MERVSVSTHNIVSVTESDIDSGTAKWRVYVFKDDEGNEVLEVVAFYTNLEGDLETTKLPTEHI